MGKLKVDLGELTRLHGQAMTPNYKGTASSGLIQTAIDTTGCNMAMGVLKQQSNLDARQGFCQSMEGLPP